MRSRSRTEAAAITLLATAVAGAAVTGCDWSAHTQRTAAEWLTPSQFRAVSIRALVAGKAPRTFTFASRSAIGQLTDTLDALPAADPRGPQSCPAENAAYAVTFLPRSKTGKSVVAETSSCSTDSITAGGVTQPALSDPENTLMAVAGRLTHTGQRRG